MTIPSFQYMTPFLQDMFQTETTRFLQHTYTRQSRKPIQNLDGSEVVDDWGQPTYVFPDPVPNQPCYYQLQKRAIVLPTGLITQNLPVLIIPASDPLAEGDFVSDVLTPPDPETGTVVVLLVGPVEVENVQPQAANTNGGIFNQAIMRSIEVIPSQRPPNE